MERELTCPICQEWFREPVMLHCTHHICSSHIEQSSQNGLLPCPVCGDITRMPEGGLAVDRSLQLVLEYWQEKASKPQARRLSGSKILDLPMCGFCEEQPAARRCLQCDGVMCEACAVTSHSKGFFKSHQIIDLEDAPVSGDFDLAQKMVCDEHPQEKLSFYCLDCRMPVCSHCLILGSHKSHQQKHIEEAYDTGKETLSAWVEKLQQRISDCEEIEDKIRQAESEVSEGATNQRNIINHEMDHLKELIETKRHQLLSKSEIEEKQKRMQLQTQEQRTQNSKSEASAMTSRSKDLLAVSSEHAFLAVVLPLIQDMKKICTQPAEPAPNVNGTFRPLMTDTQVRCLGDLDLGLPKAAAAPPVNVVTMPVHSGVSHPLGDNSPVGYSTLQHSYQHSAMSHPPATVSYLSAASPAQGSALPTSISSQGGGQPQVAYVYRKAVTPSH